MPIYEYQCKKCGIVEAIQKFTDAPLEKCPVCKAASPEKIVSASSFHLKGGGWYKSDYANKTATSSSSSKAESSTDSAPATEATPKCNSACKCH